MRDAIERIVNVGGTTARVARDIVENLKYVSIVTTGVRIKTAGTAADGYPEMEVITQAED